MSTNLTQSKLEPAKVHFKADGQSAFVLVSEADVCYRCHKPLLPGPMQVLVRTSKAPPASKKERARLTFLAFSGATQPSAMKNVVALYHDRCVPPVVFHAAAGSRPAPGRSRVASHDDRGSLPYSGSTRGRRGSRHIAASGASR